jgi:hypothetical protein
MKTFCLLFALMVASSAAFAPNLFGVHTQASRYVINLGEGLITEATDPMVFCLMVHFHVPRPTDRGDDGLKELVTTSEFMTEFEILRLTFLSFLSLPSPL